MIDETLADRQRAVRLLLRDCWLEHRHEPELMEVVWRERGRLSGELADVLGYRLQVERETARLRKLPLRAEAGGRGPRVRPDAKGGPTRDWWPLFSYRHYLLLFCLLAELERDPNRPQALISTLAEDVRRAAGEQDETVDYTMAAHRRDLCDVLRWMEDRGVLALVDGEREAFATGDDRAVEALYSIDRLRLDRMAPAFIVADCVPDELRARALAVPTSLSDEGRRSRLRQLLSRRLTEDPVVYFDDLPDDEQQYFRGQRRALADRVSAMTGLVAEHRAEGSLLIDPTGSETTDLRFPTQQRDRQAALLIGAGLAAEHHDSPFTDGDVHRAAGALLADHPAYFAHKSEDVLVREAVDQLAGLDLLAATPDGALRLRPAFGRYRDAVGSTSTPPDTQETRL